MSQQFVVASLTAVGEFRTPNQGAGAQPISGTSHQPGAILTALEQRPVDVVTGNRTFTEEWIRIGANRWVCALPVNTGQSPGVGIRRLNRVAAASTQATTTPASLRVRQGPGSQFVQVTTLSRDTRVNLLHTTTTLSEQNLGEHGTWARIGDRQWVHTRYLH